MMIRKPLEHSLISTLFQWHIWHQKLEVSVFVCVLGEILPEAFLDGGHDKVFLGRGAPELRSDEQLVPGFDEPQVQGLGNCFAKRLLRVSDPYTKAVSKWRQPILIASSMASGDNDAVPIPITGMARPLAPMDTLGTIKVISQLQLKL